MASENREHSIEQARERLRHTRAELVELTLQLQGRSPAGDAFPRSAIMRAATGYGGRMLLSGAALSLAVLRPGLLPLLARLTPWAPLLRSVANRYLVRRILR